jgi:phage protein D
MSDGTSNCKIILDNRDDHYTYEDKIQEGESISISMGFADKNSTKPVFVGTVTSVKIDQTEATRKLITVTGDDPLHCMTTGRRRRSWEKITDSDVVTKIFQEHGLKIAEVEDTGIVLPFVVQNNLNDLNFVQERAKHNGYELRYEINKEREGVVFARPKRDIGDAILRWDSDKEDQATSILQRCKFDTTTVNQPTSVKVRWYDPDAAEPIIGTASEVTGGTMDGSIRQGNSSYELQVSDIAVYSVEEAERVAQSILDQKAGEYLTGDGQSLGCPDIISGKRVKILDVGDFEGFYYVTECKHHFKVKGGTSFGYWTSFKVSRTHSHKQ